MSEQHPRKGRDPDSGCEHWAASSILAHSDYPRARAAYIRDVLSLYEHDAFLNKLLIVAARMIIFAVTICLDAGYRQEDRGTWPTVGNLKKALAPFGLASPRRIEQIVARLVQTGYLESRVSPADARARLLRPSAKMLAHDQDWLITHYRPLAILFGDADYVLPLERSRDFQRMQRRVAIGFFGRSAEVLQNNPGLMLFFSREAGILVMMQLVTESLEQDSPTIPLSLTELGERFAVSRTHIRQLLTDAEAQGMLELDRTGRHVTLKPVIFESLDRFIADGMANHDLSGVIARHELARERAIPADRATRS